ncbi:hypothetical protein EVAR_100446_1 [Eumeta japonica]|uniref:Uncharacterized protein n=1 Tax=Eumeta variegata TaxID=151549 RepID=A0A4C2A039_EUMVA|nr:hypothetical protein EVAR_100446_1 [Eumeta japonica]
MRPDKVQDLLRVLEECPIFTKERADTETATGVQILRKSFPGLLSEDKHCKMSLTFCDGVTMCERLRMAMNKSENKYTRAVTNCVTGKIVKKQLNL